MTEAPGLGRGRSYDGKAWRMLEWAVINHPEAVVIFKQDADSLVDYRRAVPTFLMMASRVAFQDKRNPKAQHPSRLSPQAYARAALEGAGRGGAGGGGAVHLCGDCTMHTWATTATVHGVPGRQESVSAPQALCMVHALEGTISSTGHFQT